MLDTSWTYPGHALQPCNGKYTLKSASNCCFSSAVNVTKKSQILLSGLQCKKSDFLNTFSGLTPVFFETKGKNRGKYEQPKDIKMYARKSGFVTKITKNDDKSYDTERAKVRKNALKVRKSRKNTNTRLIRSRSAHKAPSHA